MLPLIILCIKGMVLMWILTSEPLTSFSKRKWPEDYKGLNYHFNVALHHQRHERYKEEPEKAAKAK